MQKVLGPVLLAGALALGLPVVAQAAEFTPQVGQAGKDVIWVPTPEDLVDRMLRMAQTTSSDVVYDLGSGDGRTVIAAAKKFGATAFGIEYNPEMVTLSQRNAQREGVAGKTNFVKADLFESDLSKATVITMYLLPSINARLKPKILDLKPGTRVVSHAFDMEDWMPDQTDLVEGRRGMLWIVPAKVAGGWKLKIGDGPETDVTINQRYQLIDGTVNLPRITTSLREARLLGDRINFTIMDAGANIQAFSGRVNGDRMEGTARSASGAEVRWTARR